MANPFSLLRFANIFGGPLNLPEPSIMMDDPASGGLSGQMPRRNPFDHIDFGASKPLPTASLSDDEDLEPFKFEPEHRYSDQFDELIKQMPQRGNPGFWRKFAATLSAAGAPPGRGAEVADRNLYAPYYRDVEDWERKIKPIQAGMIDERTRNAQQRQYTQSMNTYSIAAKNAETRATRVEAQNKAEATRAETGRQSMLVRKHKAENPNHIYKTDNDGNVYGINPQTNQVSYLQDEAGNPIRGDKLPEQTRLDIQLDHALERIKASGQVQKELIPLRGAQERENIKARGAEARTTQAAPRSTAPSRTGTGARSLSESQIKVQRQNRMNEFLINNPDMKNFVRKNADGGIDIDPPSDKWYKSGPTKEQFKKAKDFILGGGFNPAPEDAAIVEFLKKNKKTVTPENIAKVKAQMARKK